MPSVTLVDLAKNDLIQRRKTQAGPNNLNLCINWNASWMRLPKYVGSYISVLNDCLNTLLA